MVYLLDLVGIVTPKNAPGAVKKATLVRKAVFRFVHLCTISHIRCDLAQDPDRVYCLDSVIRNNQRGLTTAEHYGHGGIGDILHTGPLKVT